MPNTELNPEGTTVNEAEGPCPQEASASGEDYIQQRFPPIEGLMTKWDECSAEAEFSLL